MLFSNEKLSGEPKINTIPHDACGFCTQENGQKQVLLRFASWGLIQMDSDSKMLTKYLQSYNRNLENGLHPEVWFPKHEKISCVTPFLFPWAFISYTCNPYFVYKNRINSPKMLLNLTDLITISSSKWLRWPDWSPPSRRYFRSFSNPSSQTSENQECV